MYVYVRDAANGDKLDSLSFEPLDSANFAIIFDSIEGGKDYNVDAWADHNNSGSYNAPPTDHAWRIELMNFSADTIINFQHNTNFTDIFPADDTTGGGDSVSAVTINFTGFENTVGQDINVYLRDPQTNVIIDSIMVTPIDSSDFTVVFNSVVVNQNYNIDFYTDVNANGTYDAPPADYAWRIPLTSLSSDTIIVFIFDTVYTDIELGGPITGVEEVDGEDGFTTYPNPVQDELTVNLTRGGTALSVYSLTGSLVMHRNLTAVDRIIRLNVSELKSGVYILKLSSESGSSQKKFLKE
jgi:hypothetical protein